MAGRVASPGICRVKVDLVDHLVCPRCGPPFGLVLLAIDVRDRRVHQGEFGCPNCRDRFPVTGGFGDLRPPPRGEPPGQPAEPGGERAGAAVASGVDDGGGRTDDTGGVDLVPGGERSAGRARSANPAEKAPVGAAADPSRRVALAAALGVTDGTGLVVLPDSHRDDAVALARLVPGLEVLVVGWGGRGFAGSSRAVSALVCGPVLPLRDGVVRGAVGGGGGEGWWAECLRVLMPGGRLVFRGPMAESRRWVRAAGLAAIVDERDWLVAVRAAPSRPRPP